MFKILIVDDEKLVRQGFIHMSNWIERGFMIVGEASNGVEALEVIEKSDPDIVITDIHMPVMNGVELIRTIKEKYPQIQVIVLSSYNDFNYVKETLKMGALDYILKQEMEFNELIDLLERTKIAIQENAAEDVSPSQDKLIKLQEYFLKSLLDSNQFNDDYIHEYIGKYKIELEHQRINIFIFQLDQISEDMNDNQVWDEDFINASLIPLIYNELDGICHPHIFLYDNKSIIALFNTASSNCFDLESLAKEVLNVAKNKYTLEMWALISNTFDAYSNIYPMFKKTMELSKQCFYISNPRVLSLSDQTEMIAKLDIDYKDLNIHIERLNLDVFKETIINRIENLICAETFLQPYMLKKLLIESYYYLIHKLEETGFDMTEMTKLKFTYLKNIENSNKYMVLIKVFDDMVQQINDFVSNYARYSSTVTNAINFIRTKYQDQISLSSVAEHCHVNKSYLSNLFKQQTGVNLNNYVTDFRINKAKELLRKPELDVRSVAEMVGYNDPSYFGRIFKKKVGITPLDFKKG